MSTVEIWEFYAGSGVLDDPAKPLDLTGYSVEASDGSIGKVDEATYDAGSSRVVVDTGPWISGKRSCYRQASSSGWTEMTRRCTSAAPRIRSRTRRDLATSTNATSHIATRSAATTRLVGTDTPVSRP